MAEQMTLKPKIYNWEEFLSVIARQVAKGKLQSVGNRHRVGVATQSTERKSADVPRGSSP